MNEKEIAKVRAFINDREIADVVYSVLQRNFLSKKGGSDVNMLAAQMLAVQLLSDAWTEMERHKNKPNNTKDEVNVGV